MYRCSFLTLWRPLLPYGNSGRQTARRSQKHRAGMSAIAGLSWRMFWQPAVWISRWSTVEHRRQSSATRRRSAIQSHPTCLTTSPSPRHRCVSPARTVPTPRPSYSPTTNSVWNENRWKPTSEGRWRPHPSRPCPRPRQPLPDVWTSVAWRTGSHPNSGRCRASVSASTRLTADRRRSSVLRCTTTSPSRRPKPVRSTWPSRCACRWYATSITSRTRTMPSSPSRRGELS